jgi:hypothetical protein
VVEVARAADFIESPLQRRRQRGLKRAAAQQLERDAA